MIVLMTGFDNLHQVLRTLYDDMMPLCSSMTGVAKGVAGIGALLYIAYRVWKSLANAEPIDAFPLLRPFAICLCILLFEPVVLGTINGILSPVVQGTHSLMANQTLNMDDYQKKRDELEKQAKMRDPEQAFLVSDEEFDKKLDSMNWGLDKLATMANMYAEWMGYTIVKKAQELFISFLELLFKAAALVIDTLRTFFLVVLSILGPLAFALSVFDGFQSTLTNWISRYVGIYLWLPVSDLFSAILARIQVLMIDQDIQSLQDPSYIPDGNTGVYIVFLIIGILGYFTIPTVAGWIISSQGAGSYNSTVTRFSKMSTAAAGAAGGYILGNIMGHSRGKDKDSDSNNNSSSNDNGSNSHLMTQQNQNQNQNPNQAQ